MFTAILAFVLFRTLMILAIILSVESVCASGLSVVYL